jgi:hypothetical protein
MLESSDLYEGPHRGTAGVAQGSSFLQRRLPPQAGSKLLHAAARDRSDGNVIDRRASIENYLRSLPAVTRSML